MAAMEGKKLSFIHISDTHIGPGEDYDFRSYRPSTLTRSLLKEIQKDLSEASFVIHTGDVCGDKDAHADAQAYQLAETLFQDLSLPLYTVAGNHDETSLLKSTFPPPGVNWISEAEDRLAYTFECEGFRFVVLDAAVRGKRAGVLPEDQRVALESLLVSQQAPLVIFLHYPPIPLHCNWMDETMLLEDGLKFHELLKPYASIIRGVFFGHVHQPLQILRDGILYACAPASIFQFNSFAQAPDAAIDTTIPSGFNFVTLTSDDIRINPRCLRTL